MTILDKIKNGESEILEFKENFNKKCIETAIAFSNTRGGTLLVGVDNKGTIKGCSVNNEALKIWSNEIAQNSEPTVAVEIYSELINNKLIVVINFPEYPLKPVSTKGRCFRRVSASNKQMTPQEIAQMHMLTTGSSWDALPIQDKSLDDINIEKVGKYISIANAVGRRNFPKDISPLDILRKLELIKHEKPTWAALLLFGHDPQARLLQATVHCGRFREGVHIMDDRLISGSIIEQIDEVMDFIKKHINVQYVITGKARHDAIWDYPLDALREAVVNAIAHRDYSENSDIQIKVFDNSISIWSPGLLPFNVSLEELYDKTHNSKPRNKLIAQVFYDMEIIERYGSGTSRIIEECQKAKNPIPEFLNEHSGFAISFEALQKEINGGPVGGPVGGAVENISDKILNVLKSKPSSIKEIRVALGLKSKTGALKRSLQGLLSHHIIEMTIPEKPKSRFQQYRIVEKSGK